MPQFSVIVTRTLEQSACLRVRAKNAESAQAKVQDQIDSGVIWEELRSSASLCSASPRRAGQLTKNSDVEELDQSITIEEVDEA